MKQKFAIVDVETTGGRAADEKITEIAIVIHDGERVVEQFSSLVNPERPVPFNITMLTGITNEMVATAPKFYEIAKKIVTITQDCIFVAHNVRFDYSFVQEEFRRLGYLYTKRQLCTVKLSRKTFPGLHSYSLENLIRHFNIPFQYRHRALDDTLATVNIFEKIITSAIGQQQIAHNLKQGIKETKLPNNITLEVLNNIPEVCGVYYFHNEKGDVVYVGKSINMQKRILEHFSDGSEKGDLIHKYVYDISYELASSELMALLHESYEIKRLKPLINRAQRNETFPYVIRHFINNEGYISLCAEKVQAKQLKHWNVISDYPKLMNAKSHLTAAAEQFNLCFTLCHLDYTSVPCFRFHTKNCAGACIGAESATQYNQRAWDAIDYLAKTLTGSKLIIERGFGGNDQAIVYIREGELFGFKNFHFSEFDSYTLNGIISDFTKVKSNPEVIRIIRNYLSKNIHRLQIVEL